MAESLTGPGGFYRAPGAAGRHFRTAAGSGRYARALLDLAARLDDALGRPRPFDVVDLGAGDGRLLAALRRLAPAGRRDRWRWTAVELSGAPPGLPADVRWLPALPERVCGLVVANEWLDTVAVDVVVDRGGPRLLAVDPLGAERPAGRPAAADLAWLARYWPLCGPGSRAEVGRRRDIAWVAVVGRLARGAALAVDYPARPGGAGTLTGYRAGRQVPARPDGAGDVTAGVLFASVAAAGARPGGATRLLTQRRALAVLGARPARRAPGGPGGPLAALAEAGEEAELRDRGGFGGFRWLLQTTPGVAAEGLLQTTPGVAAEELLQTTPGVAAEGLLHAAPGMAAERLLHAAPGMAAERLPGQW